MSIFEEKRNCALLHYVYCIHTYMHVERERALLIFLLGTIFKAQIIDISFMRLNSKNKYV